MAAACPEHKGREVLASDEQLNQGGKVRLRGATSASTIPYSNKSKESLNQPFPHQTWQYEI